MKFSAIYGNGALMGFTPPQIKLMSLWEFQCAFAAWARFNGAKSDKPSEGMTIERLHELGVE